MAVTVSLRVAVSPVTPVGSLQLGGRVNSDVYSISCFMFHLRSVQLIIGGTKNLLIVRCAKVLPGHI